MSFSSHVYTFYPEGANEISSRSQTIPDTRIWRKAFTPLLFPRWLHCSSRPSVSYKLGGSVCAGSSAPSLPLRTQTQLSGPNLPSSPPPAQQLSLQHMFQDRGRKFSGRMVIYRAGSPGFHPQYHKVRRQMFQLSMCSAGLVFSLLSDETNPGLHAC